MQQHTSREQTKLVSCGIDARRVRGSMSIVNLAIQMAELTSYLALSKHLAKWLIKAKIEEAILYQKSGNSN